MKTRTRTLGAIGATVVTYSNGMGTMLAACDEARASMAGMLEQGQTQHDAHHGGTGS